MQNVLNLWRMRNIALEGKMIIRKQKAFIWNNLTPKIKHETYCNSFEEGGLKNVDINSKVASVQCSWVKRLYDDLYILI